MDKQVNTHDCFKMYVGLWELYKHINEIHDESRKRVNSGSVSLFSLRKLIYLIYCPKCWRL